MRKDNHLEIQRNHKTIEGGDEQCRLYISTY